MFWLEKILKAAIITISVLIILCVSKTPDIVSRNIDDISNLHIISISQNQAAAAAPRSHATNMHFKAVKYHFVGFHQI